MKNILLIFAFSFLFKTILFTQNLITNGNFEELIDCKLGEDSIAWTLGWSDPTALTSDLFSSCGNTFFGVPNNLGGFQNSFAGDSTYVGFFSYGVPNGQNSNIREYVQTQLNDQLIGCNKYELSMYVSLADTFRFAINSIGAYLSSTSIQSNDIFCFDQFEPQVNNPKTRMLMDKENWTKIAGQFIANGDEQYITFGNFHLDSEIDTLSTFQNTFQFGHSSSYYYLDNVSLVLVSDENTLAFAGIDTTIYVGDSTFIGQDIYNLNCTWRKLDGTLIADSMSGIWVSPPETTTYLCEQNLCGIITYDTIIVSTIYKNPTISLNGSTNLCTGDSLVLSTNVTNGILWHPNEETSSSITITEQGSYYLSQTVNELTTYSDTINVTFNTTPTPELSFLNPLCDTTSPFLLNNGLPVGGVYFVNGEQTTFFDASYFDPGEYELVYQVNNANCFGFDTTMITVVTCSVGLEEKENNNDIFVYPNPSKDKFIIVGNNIEEVIIYDLFGRKIDFKLEKINKNNIITEIKSQGLYHCLVKTNLESKIFLIQIIK
jgi:hypothetical protein